ncbi:alpha/beta fold hydrolase [Microbacterium sp. BG28]|uniref:alpha/beta fold hydrolase n=1 Tax=Microbacterium sp. BG28 TaxID=3097356 RepID=UPI002A5A115D|nr:alpha/beta fold hydrolase [Microbacterium sp. BG28]MDY0828613.1 alpha/beta fold hydrolase [Microbacterium sp. BG28]
MRSSVPAVFVHGLFDPFAEPATFRQLGDRECTAPDLDGYGAFAARRVTLEGQVRALRGHVVARRSGAPVHLVAHSIGAVYAFALADRHPELVESLTTVEGNFSRRLDDPAAFLAADGVPVTDESLARAGRRSRTSHGGRCGTPLLRSWMRPAGPTTTRC